MKLLTKSQENKMVAGVCGGLGRYFNIDPALLRVGFVVATVFGVGMPIVLYAVLAAVLPQERYW
ncbi:PspC domain-containing protein [Rhodoflexus caldus]|uniref:PspC domain-containing protein n=1 Tax=Rhodoflexus caldus TaxID=2891236 RepID=UPI00202A1310|nr:PspC domain-containing protein [Rhodoflexus caldus]